MTRKFGTLPLIAVALLLIGARFSSCGRASDRGERDPVATSSDDSTSTSSSVQTTSPSTESSAQETGSAASALAISRAYRLDSARAEGDLNEFVLSPHPFGSPRQKSLADWLSRRMAEAGLTAVSDHFVATVPNPSAGQGAAEVTTMVDGYNVLARGAVALDAPCVVALASHYDSKIVAGTEYVGANDSGSSSVAVLDILTWLKSNSALARPRCDIIGIWFDGEEAVLPGWSDGLTSHPARIQDNTYGSRSLASRLEKCEYAGASVLCLPASLGGQPLLAVVLLDMVGSGNVRLSRDGHSTASLMEAAIKAAIDLGMPELLNSKTLRQDIEDDHIPFLERGIKAIDLIDFHHLEYWHAHGDTKDNISFASIEKVARLALHLAYDLATTAKP